MKKLIIILFFCFCSTIWCVSQNVPNFFSTKQSLSVHYDSIIQLKGVENMQGTDYYPYQRWVSYWEPILYPHGDFLEQHPQSSNKYIKSLDIL